MNKIEALYSFWSSFRLPAFDETRVPDGEKLPYITYETANDEFGSQLALAASLWYRSESWEDVSLKEMEIAERITRGGIIVKYDGGAFWLRKGSPWAQRMADSSDDMIRRIALNIELEFLDQ